MKKSNSILKLVPYLVLFLVAVTVSSCSNSDAPTPTPTPTPVPPVVVVPGFPGPSYLDNYTSISS
ncbi:MAG: arabinan endo-1,5-alpha-L-arabinosidase, partial [bacterium]|nr:arabinan endo-1,5-alpha-L-arabinosidase [bacterium]